MQRFRGGLVFQAHRLCVSLNYRLESNQEEDVGVGSGFAPQVAGFWRAVLKLKGPEHGVLTPH